MRRPTSSYRNLTNVAYVPALASFPASTGVVAIANDDSNLCCVAHVCSLFFLNYISSAIFFMTAYPDPGLNRVLVHHPDRIDCGKTMCPFNISFCLLRVFNVINDMPVYVSHDSFTIVRESAPRGIYLVYGYKFRPQNFG